MRLRMTRASAVLAGGLGLVAIVTVVTLSGSPLVVADTNGTPAEEAFVEAGTGASICQSGEVLPAGISAIRLTLQAAVGPRVGVFVLSGTHVLVHGLAESGWTAGNVTAPLKALAHARSDVSVCFVLGPSAEPVLVGGSTTSVGPVAKTSTGRMLSGRFTVEYMRSGSSSWWSMLRTVALHMGFGRAPSGSWIALLVALLMGSALVAGSWLAVRELR